VQSDPLTLYQRVADLKVIRKSTLWEKTNGYLMATYGFCVHRRTNLSGIAKNLKNGEMAVLQGTGAHDADGFDSRWRYHRKP